MVRKVSAAVCVLVLIFAFGISAQAATHSVYENGSLGTTYITYFKDILSGAKFDENYVAFRSGQYSYSMVVGDIEYNNGEFNLNGSGKEYIFSTESSGYNSQYKYYINDITSFSLNSNNAIIYSDVGGFPQLIERGAKYEMLTTLILFIVCVCFIIRGFFNSRFR